MRVPELARNMYRDAPEGYQIRVALPGPTWDGKTSKVYREAVMTTVHECPICLGYGCSLCSDDGVILVKEE